jgi:hypothetical protein
LMERLRRAPDGSPRFAWSALSRAPVLLKLFLEIHLRS